MSQSIAVKTVSSSKNLPTIPKSPSTKYHPVVIENYKHLTRDGSVVDYSLSDDEEHYPNPHANIVGGSDLLLGPSNGMPDEIPFQIGEEGIDGTGGLGGGEAVGDASAAEAALEREKEQREQREQRERERAQAVAQRQAETQAFISKVLDFEHSLAFEAELAVPRTVLLLGKSMRHCLAIRFVLLCYYVILILSCVCLYFLIVSFFKPSWIRKDLTPQLADQERRQERATDLLLRYRACIEFGSLFVFWTRSLLFSL
jgi:hypothetical protein